MRRYYGSTSFGFDPGGTAPQLVAPRQSITQVDAKTQEGALKILAELAQRATVHPLTRQTALKITADCANRADTCELEAIFRALHSGNPDVEPFANGFKYMADPRFADYFASPVDNIQACLKGACGGDCDDHAAMMVALAGSIGWKGGLRAWGPKNGEGYSHVYAVVAYPKRPPFKKVVALDSTVPESFAGWEPPKGNVLTAWLE